MEIDQLSATEKKKKNITKSKRETLKVQNKIALYAVLMQA